jgi:hypothetical protein
MLVLRVTKEKRERKHNSQLSGHDSIAEIILTENDNFQFVVCYLLNLLKNLLNIWNILIFMSFGLFVMEEWSSSCIQRNLFKILSS